jgi:hypothetical protein
VLDDADVVDEREQVVGAHAHELRVAPSKGPAAARRQLDGFKQDGCGRFGHGGPGELCADPPCLGPGGGEAVRIVHVAADGLRERRRIAERDDFAGP